MLIITRNLSQWILCIGLAYAAQACMPTGFLASKNSGASQSLATEPKVQANDRPTEAGAGVPGYLVNCSEMSATGELVQVGCNVTNSEGSRVKVSADAWTRYDIKLGAGVNASIKVTKSISTGGDVWDVAFLFTGATPAELRAAAKASTYSYTYVDENGKTVKAESATPVATTTKPAASQTSQNCSGGVVVENVCVVSVPLACTDYCGQSQMTVHPWVVERYGANKQSCSDLYAQFPDANSTTAQAGTGGAGGAGSSVSFPFPITEILTDRGLGCHRLSSGQPMFDTGTPNPASEPYYGYTRICACQP